MSTYNMHFFNNGFSVLLLMFHIDNHKHFHTSSEGAMTQPRENEK